MWMGRVGWGSGGGFVSGIGCGWGGLLEVRRGRGVGVWGSRWEGRVQGGGIWWVSGARQPLGSVERIQLEENFVVAAIRCLSDRRWSRLG